MKAMIAAILLLGTLAVPAQSSAAELLFTLNSGAGVLTFQLESPTGDPGVATDDYFGFWDVDASLDGVPITLELIQFWAGAPARGGFEARTTALQVFSATGPQLYSGTTHSPTFLLGSFATRGGEMSIAPVAAAVPEPATWALMILGFGAAGVALRRQNTWRPTRGRA